MCLTLGLYFMIVIGYYVLKYVKENYHERKKNREVSQHSLIMSFEEEEEEKRMSEKKRKKQIEEMREKKKEKIRLKKKEEMKSLANQIVERSSILYDCIRKDYTLINKFCLLCARKDKIPIVNKINLDYDEDYEDNEDYEDYEDNENYDNLIINYNKNIKINVIDDINNGEYKSFKGYIYPKYCEHFYHKSCCKNYNNIYKRCVNNRPLFCYFCSLFLTVKNMQRFGCFFSKKIFTNIFKNIYNDTLDIQSTRKEIIKAIENIFYSKVENSSLIDEDKKWRILQIKQMNDKFLENFRLLKKIKEYENYDRFYELSINSDIVTEEENLDSKIYEQEEEIEKSERRAREREEREKEERRKRAEEKERRRPVFLKRCEKCRDVCLFCGGKVLFVGPSHMRAVYNYKAHGTCIPNNDYCCICHKNKATTKCNNQCYYCSKNKNLVFIEEKCYYCREKLNKWNQ